MMKGQKFRQSTSALAKVPNDPHPPAVPSLLTDDICTCSGQSVQSSTSSHNQYDQLMNNIRLPGPDIQEQL